MNDEKKLMVSFQDVKKYFPKGNFLNKKYIHAVNGISFDLYEGEILAVVGESGCGKTTLARMLIKLYEPTGGVITVEGEDITRKMNRKALNFFRSKVQMIYQDPFGSLNPAHNCGNIVSRAIELHNHGLSKEEINHRVVKLFETVGLTPAEDFMSKHPSQLSGGQRQRIVIARALAVNPSILIADEPTSMLDVSIGIDIMNLMLDLRAKNRLTFIYITHNLASARYMADKIAVMYAGTCVEQGDIDSVIEKPYHPYTTLLLSSTPEPFRKEKPEIHAREDLPDLTNVGQKCLFCARCPLAMEKCSKNDPPIFTVGERKVKCFLYENREPGFLPPVDASIFSK